MKLALVLTLVEVPKVAGKVNDRTKYLLARDGHELERQKNGDITVSKAGKVVAFIGAANVAYAEPAGEV